MDRSSGKVALITGSGSGIGRAAAASFAKKEVAQGETVKPRWQTMIDAAHDPTEAKYRLPRKTLQGRLAEPRGTALDDLFLASNYARYANDHVLSVDGGLIAGFYKGRRCS